MLDAVCEAIENHETWLCLEDDSNLLLAADVKLPSLLSSDLGENLCCNSIFTSEADGLTCEG